MKETSRIDFSDHPSDTAVHRLDRGEVRRDLDARDLFVIGFVGVGSSICYALGAPFLRAGELGPHAFGVAALIFCLTAFTYAELGAAIPEAGGAQIFARRAFNSDLASFIAGWSLLLAYILMAAISAFSIAPYWSWLFPRYQWLCTPPGCAVPAAAVISIFVIEQIARMQESRVLRLCLSALCLAAVWLILAFQSNALESQGPALPTLPGDFRAANLVSPWTFLEAVALAMAAFTGIESLSQHVGEVQEPGRSVPRALRRMIVAVVALYALVIGGALLGDPRLFQSWSFLGAPVLGLVDGPGWEGPARRIMAGIVSTIVLTALLMATRMGVVGASRLASSMMAHYQLPAPPALQGRWQIQFVPLIAISSIAVLVLILAPHLPVLIALYVIGALLAWIVAHASLIGLRVREPNLERPYRSPLNLRMGGIEWPVTACLGLAATLGVWTVALVMAPEARWLGLGWMFLGGGMYVLYRRRSEMPVGRAVEIAKVTVPEFAPVAVKHVLVPTLGGASTEVVQIAARIAKANGAALTAMYVMQVPPALPIDTLLGDQQYLGEKALTRAEAIGREYGLAVTLKLVQSREAGPTIVDVAREEGADLIVLGAAPPGGKGAGTLGAAVDYVVREAKSRVWVCTLPPSFVARREAQVRDERKAAH